MKNLEMKNNILAVFGKKFPNNKYIEKYKFNTIIADNSFKEKIEILNCNFIDIKNLISPGSIYEATSFAKEFARLQFPNGERVVKSFMYKGYELWWMNYGTLFLYFCLPYTQYKKLLEFLKDFQNVYLYEPPYKSLFSCYLKNYGCDLKIYEQKQRIFPIFTFGIFLQIALNTLYIPILIFRKNRIMIFIGDKFDKNKDYDFRMKFIYDELRERKLDFVEFVRSLESWKIIIKHALVRKRPVVYSEAVAFCGSILSTISGGRRKAKKIINSYDIESEEDLEKRFKLSVATQYLFTIYDDIWAIRIMKFILKIIGVKTAIPVSASERNFHAVLGCKLNNIPTVGVLHGFASSNYNMYDFMHCFDGEKTLSVDRYGLWSEWWREYYIKNSNAYKPKQLFVSSMMRPLKFKNNITLIKPLEKNSLIKVLFVPGQLSEVREIIPYLKFLIKTKDISVRMTVRPYRDDFERRLRKHNQEIIKELSENKIIRGDINDAISQSDIVVGSNSTAVIEALLQNKPVVLFDTKKWGDYFDLKNYNLKYKFFAENPEELTDLIKKNINIPKDELKKLQKRFFGDINQNGSKWVVDEVEKDLL